MMTVRTISRDLTLVYCPHYGQLPVAFTTAGAAALSLTLLFQQRKLISDFGLFPVFSKILNIGLGLSR